MDGDFHRNGHYSALDLPHSVSCHHALFSAHVCMTERVGFFDRLGPVGMMCGNEMN